MTDACPHVESAEIDLPLSRRALPEPALGAAAATWQAILRVRHPEFAGLIVEVIDDNASDTAGSERGSRSHASLEAVMAPPSDAAALVAARTAASGR